MSTPTHPSASAPPGPAPSRSEQRYRALVEATSQVVWVATELGTVADDLPTWRAFTGQTYEQMRGFGWMTAIHPDDQEYASDIWKHSLAGAVAHEQEFRVRRHDGQYRLILARAVPVKSDAGKVVEWVGSFSDVTERRAAQEAVVAGREQLRSITDIAPVYLAQLDARRRFRFVNRAYAERFKLNPADLVGRHVWEVLGPDAYETLRPYMDRVLTGETVEYEVDIDYPVLGRRYMRCRYGPEKDATGKVTGFVAVVADETERRKMEQAVRESEHRLRVITDALPVLIAYVDAGHRYRFNNRTYAAWFGLDHTTIAGMHMRDVLGEDVYQHRVPYVAAALSGRHVRFEGPTRHRVKGVRQTEVNYVPDVAEDGSVLGFYVLIHDVTEARQSEQVMRENERVLAEAQELAHVGSWELDLGDPEDLSRNRVRWSAETYRIFGLTPGEVEATYDLCLQLVHDDDRETLADAVQRAVREGRPLQVEHRIVRPDGVVRVVQQRGTVARDPTGRSLRITGTCQDVTDRKAAETQLRDHAAENRRLFQQAEQARTQAEVARAQAEASNKAKDQFLAVLSHELRTPLTPVVMTVASLETEPGLPPHLRDDLAMIRRNIALETRLIDDLLDVSRIINGKMTLHPQTLDVHALLRGVAEMTASEARGKQIEIRWDLRAEDDQVRADSARLHQVLWNLIKNAIKFTPEHGAITIRTATISPRRIQVQVEDSGIGIDADVLPRIFNAFDQGEIGTTRRFGGLGLGLTISKAIVDLHGGTLIAESEGRGRGARFTLELATTGLIDRLVNQLSPSPHLQEHARLRVLLVEDHPDTMKMLRRLLESSGYVVTTASSVTAAKALIESHTFDILVSDIGLPDGTGLELVRSVRAKNLAIPGIAITGYGMDHDVQSSLEAGFSAHLTKPVDFDALETTMRRLVRAAPAFDLRHEGT